MNDEVSFIQNAGPFLGILSMMIGWIFFLIALSMFKNFISKGFSMAVAEFMLKHASHAQREKIARWFADSDMIMDSLVELDEKLKPGEGRVT